MNKRERTLAVIVGVGVFLAAVYYGLTLVYLNPLKDARAQYANLLTKKRNLDRLVRTERKLKKQWKGYVARTFSYEASEAQDLFGQDLKRIAERHGFTSPNFNPRNGTRIGRNTGISTLAYHISDTGEYSKVVAFLRDIYATPYLCQITSLAITPLGPKAGRDRVKVELTVETPLLPRIEKKDVKGLQHLATLSDDPDRKPGPYREGLPPPSTYLVLEDRNVFRAFMPAPTNMVMIDNQDLKTVGLILKFFWEGKVKEQLTEQVAGKSQKPISGKGDVVEIVGSYADGTAFGPVRIDFTQAREGAYQVASHTPEPADTVILAVHNPLPEDVFVDVVITAEDGKETRPPSMLIKAGATTDLGQWKASQVRVTARYKSEKVALERIFTPSKSRQLITIPKEPSTAVAVAPPTAPEDPPPDGKYTVTGLLTYRKADTYEYAQEMIVTAGAERKIISRGEPGVVDSGTLLAVHPLGGIVKMPSGHYYLYPLGKSFTDRVLLQAEGENELVSAIDAWTRR
ncbi:MAG: hypothetical protein ACE5E1_01780 [Phycisphaerae bacterium]